MKTLPHSSIRRFVLPCALIALAYLFAVAPLLAPLHGPGFAISTQGSKPASTAGSNASAHTPSARSWASDATPQEAFQALQARSAQPLAVHWSRAGVADFLRAQHARTPLPYTPSASEQGQPLAVAFGFLDENRALWGFTSAAQELQLLRAEPDKQLGYSHLRLAQRYQNLPVWGHQLVVHLDAQQRVLAVNGQFAPKIQVATQPTLPKAEAEQVALRSLREGQLSDEERARVQLELRPARTELVVYIDAQGKARLAWAVTILSQRPLGQWQLFINARRPALAHAFNSVEQARRRVTFSADNTTEIPGRQLADEGERTRDQIGQVAHDAAGTVYDYYFNTFKRDAYDGQGSPMVSTVHYGSDPQDAENAAWIGEAKQMIYGDGGEIFKPLPLALDVVGHEFTHGVVDSTSSLVYEGQSGALNESFADIFGVLIDPGNWVIGEKVVKSPPFPVPYIRSLEDPNAEGNYDPNDPLRGVGQPASMDQYANLPLSRRADNGGVHINSGIPNHVAFLVQQQISPEKMAQIYYRTMTQYLTPEAQFADAANASVQAAGELYGQAEADAVRNAFGQVGITVGGGEVGPTPPASGGDQVPVPQQPQPPAPPAPQGCNDLIVNGGFENDQAWTEVVRGSTKLLDTELPRTGARSAWLGGTDEEPLQYLYQDVQIPANAVSVKLRHYRLLHKELKNVLSLFAGEARFSAVIADTSGNVLDTLEELSSAQADDTWREADFDLSRLAGKKVRLVYALENPRGNVSSAFVDDVALLACTQGQGPAAPPTNSQEQVFLKGTLSDADTGRGIEGAQIFILKPGVSAQQAAQDDTLTDDEVLTQGLSDGDGVYQTEAPVQRGKSYSAIVIASGYRPILSDGGVEVPNNAPNPFPVDATLRRGR